MAHRIAIIVLVVGYLALAATYSMVTPLGEGPDEPGHAKYVFFLAREARLPVQCSAPCVSDVPGEGHQPPLAYALAATALLWLPQEQRTFDLPGNLKFVWLGGNETNAVAHGSREYWPWKGAVLAWHLARLVNVGLGAVTVVVTYFAGRRMFGAQVGLAAAAVIALNPQFLFTSGLVTNDTLLTLLCAGLLVLLVHTGSKPIVQALAIGAVLGLALITKQSALVLVPIAGLWCLGAGTERAGVRSQESGVRSQNRERPNDRTAERPNQEFKAENQEPRTTEPRARNQPGLRQWLVPVITRGVCVFGMALLISGWWYLRNWRLYGDPLGLAVFQAEFVTQAFEANRLDAWLSGIVTLHNSFWARFGWMNVPAPSWVIGCALVLELLAVAGIVRGLLAWRAVPATQPTNMPWYLPLVQWWPLILLPVLTFAWLVSFALTAGLVAWQGRLLFPALPAVAIILGYGLVRLREPRSQESGVRSQESGVTTENSELRTAELQNDRTENPEPMPLPLLRCAAPNGRGARSAGATRILSWLAALGGFGIALWLPFGVIEPAYPFQTLPAAEAVGRLGTPVYARFAARADERGAELRGVRIDGSPRPGETLTVTLIWHALGRQNRNWQVFIHLVDDQETILAEDNREPRNGQLRMSQWVVGDWVEDPHPLKLPADIAPGTYRIRVGLWYIKTGGRAGRYSSGDELLGDFIDVGSVTVVQ